MSDQQLDQLEALLAKVQKNRRQDEQRAGHVGHAAAAAPAMSAASPRHSEPPSTSVRRPAADQRRPGTAEKPVAREEPAAAPAVRRGEHAVGPVAAPVARREPAQAASVQRGQPQRTSHAPAAPEPIVPRVIEPDPPRATNRPIAQLVSKHVTAVDATFGAMLKRSLSLRPH
jgi:hypothetical protein